MTLPPVWIIAGPTASGKSAMAVQIAKTCNGVVINADSMQVYREIPVVSAQPPVEEQEGVPHLLYGFRSVAQHYSAADWARDALAAIDETLAAGQQPILVGGSGLYLKTLTEGLSPMPDVPMAVRKHVCDLYDMLGPEGFHAALSKVDPVIAKRLHPTDRQRCIRAREIFEVSGEPLSAWQAQPKEQIAAHLRFRSLVLMPVREWLHERINRRFEMMVENGAIDEARLINRMSLPEEMTGTRAVGLRSLRDYVDHRLTLNEAIEQGQTLSRQYAKRQYTWFRGQELPEPCVLDDISAESVVKGQAWLQS